MIELPTPLFERNRITTLIGPADNEMAALAAALALSYKIGVPLVPGFVPEGPSEVIAYCYAGTWISWKGLLVDIANAARITPPVISLRCPDKPLIDELAVKRDPEARAYWKPFISADVDAAFAVAEAAGRDLSPVLTVIFNVAAAAGAATTAAVRELYEANNGQTVLMAGFESDESWLGDFGPVVRLPRLHESLRWRDMLAHITGGDSVSSHRGQPERRSVNGRQVQRVQRSRVDPGVPEMLEEVRSFFAIQGIEAFRAYLRDGHSEESQILKASARALGITSGRLWKAAMWLERNASQPNNGPATLYGYGAVFGQWREVNSGLLGHYLERIAAGAFSKAIAEARSRMKVTFRHGKDPHLGYRSLGPLTVLQEDDCGVYYEVELAADDDVRSLVPGLRAGIYGSSFTFDVLAEDFVKHPRRSRHNPLGLPELTIREVRCSELGPVYRPAYAGTSAGIRLTS